jgi:nucleotide-binding universal stress UspA family protein
MATAFNMATALKPVPATVNSILALTDFSPRSIVACDFAADLARQFHARLHLAHFVQQRDLEPPAPETYSIYSDLERHSETELKQLAEQSARTGLEAKTHLERNEILARINSLAREVHTDVMVVASRGRSGLAKLALGSTTAEILRIAQAPVLVLGPRAKPPMLPFRQVLAATNFSIESRASLSAAITLTASGSAGTHLLHVVNWEEAAKEDWPQRARTIEARMWAMLPPDARFWGMAETSIRLGNPADVILQAAAEEKADLIAIGASRAFEHPSPHRSHDIAYRVLQRATCPVLITRK